MCSSIWSEPSGWTTTWTSASGSEKSRADAPPAKTSAARRRPRRRAGASEADLRRLARRRLLELEVLALLEVEEPGDDVRRDALERGVVREDGVVVDLPGDRDLVLGLLELALELLEVLGRAKLRVLLGE